ncbi:MAG: hypothetical protein SGI87_02455 [Flavobacteriales bacterium]|nr:hypothetical protein [Flavobacteriales bacterium]
MFETLRNALLITLLVVLVYVLYKRVLSALGKDEIKERYVYFTEDSLQDGGSTKIGIETKLAQDLKLSVYKNSGELLTTIHQGSMEQGIHYFDMSEHSLAPGKYYCEMITEKQKDSIYFNIA